MRRETRPDRRRSRGHDYSDQTGKRGRAGPRLHPAEKAWPFVEKANATFTTVVDQANLLGQLYGFKAIPNGFLIDEQGTVSYKELGTFDVRRAEKRELVEKWVRGSTEPSPEEESASVGPRHAEANGLFRRGQELYAAGQVDEAVALWREGASLEPDNYIIRKQIWAVENPDKFYAGDVDFDWQKEQLSQGL